MVSASSVAVEPTTKRLKKPGKKFGSLGRRRQLTGFLFVLPAVLFTLTMFIFPLIMTAWMSLHDWPLLGQPTFRGLGNYSDLVADGQFWSGLWFTVQYTLLVTPPIFIFAFVLALLINTSIRGVGIFARSTLSGRDRAGRVEPAVGVAAQRSGRHHQRYPEGPGIDRQVDHLVCGQEPGHVGDRWFRSCGRRSALP